MLNLLLAGAQLLTDGLASRNNARAQKKALAAQTQATQAQTQQNQRMYDQTRADYQPYVQSGYRDVAARDEYLGRASNVNAMGASGVQGGGSPYADYVNRNPDLLAAYNASGGQYGNIEAFGQTHYDTHGQGEGRQLYAPQAETSQPAQNGPQNALAGFDRSAYGQIERDPMLMDRVNTAFAAKGMSGDSATSNAMARALSQDRYARFTDYSNDLRGGISQGASAVGAVGQFGANFAQNQNALAQNQANAMGSSYAAKAANQNQVIGTINNAFGQIAGSWGKKKKSSWGGF